MLRIVVAEKPDRAATLELEGRVSGPWVIELQKSCEEALARSPRVALDLSNVSFVDRDGIELFRHLRDRDVTLVNCSPFVTAQLRAGGAC